MTDPELIPFPDRYEPPVPPEQALATFHDALRRRRSVRDFSDRPVPRATIEWLVRCAHTAPSGANKQPWRFVCVQDPAVKQQIRAAAEKEEREFYQRRANDEWLDDLAPLGTDETKEFLTVAPWLVVVFEELHRPHEGGKPQRNYYTKESVGIACGMFISAIHNMGLCTLTHTPSPMRFLNEILDRPANERPFALLVVGYPEQGTRVPDITKKPLQDISTFH